MQKTDLLVVEDDPALARLICYNLEKQNYSVRHAGDGEEALEQVRQRQPDLILLDWMLPGMSGIEVCRRLREQNRTASLPIIMLSARGEEADSIRGLDIGADDYLVKPFGMDTLFARVKAILRRAPRRTRPFGLKIWLWIGWAIRLSATGACCLWGRLNTVCWNFLCCTRPRFSRARNCLNMHGSVAPAWNCGLWMCISAVCGRP